MKVKERNFAVIVFFFIEKVFARAHRTPPFYLNGDPPSPFPGVHDGLKELAPAAGASPSGLLTGVVGPGVEGPCPPKAPIGGVSVLSIRWPSLFTVGGL